MAAKKQRNKINYGKFEQLWNAGKSYQQIGDSLGIKGKEKHDPYKPVRAIASLMLNAKAGAWRDSSGKPKILAPREGMRAIGKGKKAPKPKTSKKIVSITKAKKASKKLTLPKVDGKTLAAGA